MEENISNDDCNNEINEELFQQNDLSYDIIYDKNTNIYITENNLYYLSLHLKLSSLFYSTQLVDIFSYELPINNNIENDFCHLRRNVIHQFQLGSGLLRCRNIERIQNFQYFPFQRYIQKR